MLNTLITTTVMEIGAHTGKKNSISQPVLAITIADRSSAFIGDTEGDAVNISLCVEICRMAIQSVPIPACSSRLLSKFVEYRSSSC